MMLEDIRNKIKKKKHFLSHREKPFIYSIRDTGNTCLEWKYGRSKVFVESDDWVLVSTIDDVIKIYLEENGD